MPGFLTDDQLATFLDVTLKPEPSTTRAAWWTDAITRANSAAWTDVRQALGARGFTAGQIAAWASGPDYQGQQGLYYLVLWGHVATPVPGQDVDKLDKREELKTVPVVDAGGAQVPAQATPLAGVGHGTMETATEKQRRLCAEQRQRERGGPLEYFNW